MNLHRLVMLAASLLLAGGCASTSSMSAATAPENPAAAIDYGAIMSLGLHEDGEVHGVPAADSKFTGLQIGMSQSNVENRIGHGSDMRSYLTGKVWIPFYFGTDGHRFEIYYAGQGSLTYTGGGIAGGRGVLIGIRHDASEDGYQ